MSARPGQSPAGAGAGAGAAAAPGMEDCLARLRGRLHALKNEAIAANSQVEGYTREISEGNRAISAALSTARTHAIAIGKAVAVCSVEARMQKGSAKF